MLFPFFSPDNSNYASPKRWCLLHVVETQIIIIIILTAVKTSHLTMSKKFQIVTRTVYNVRQGMDQSFENSLLLHRSMNQKTPSATMSVTDVFPRNTVCERTVLKQCPCCTRVSESQLCAGKAITSRYGRQMLGWTVADCTAKPHELQPNGTATGM